MRQRPSAASCTVSTLRVLKVVSPASEPRDDDEREIAVDRDAGHEGSHDVDEQHRPRPRRPGRGAPDEVAQHRADGSRDDYQRHDQGGHSSTPIGGAAVGAPSRSPSTAAAIPPTIEATT